MTPPWSQYPLPDFWEHTLLRPSGCWVWRGDTGPDGFGIYPHNGVLTPVRRLAALLIFGPDAIAGRAVLTRCGNNICINPAHFRLITMPRRTSHPTA